jgi:hypothetical protein
MEAIRENPRRLILFGLVLLVLICLIAYLLFNIFFSNNDQIIGGPTSAPTQVAATEEPTLAATPEEPTLTPTRVLSESPTTAPSTDETATPTPTPAVLTPTPTPISTASAGVAVSTSAPRPGEIKNLIKNGDFEQGFDERGVALQWEPFKNDNVQAIYGRETFPYVESGSSAQRITVLGASEFNRYAGIYQPVEVVSGQVYTLTLHGQIRTGLGDVNQSSFGYRIQYAVSETGLKNWQNVPEADWVELPWDEQLINVPATKFYSYTTTIEPGSDNISLFVRAWNKWPDPGEVHYTLDSFSLVGPSSVAAPVLTSAGAPATTSAATTPAAGQGPMVDKGLPTTGAGEETGFVYDGRFWGGILILLLLASGAIYRARWSY